MHEVGFWGMPGQSGALWAVCWVPAQRCWGSFICNLQRGVRELCLMHPVAGRARRGVLNLNLRINGEEED